MRPLDNAMTGRTERGEVGQLVGRSPVFAEVLKGDEVMHVEVAPQVSLGDAAPLAAIAVSCACAPTLVPPVIAPVVAVAAIPRRTIRAGYVAGQALPLKAAVYRTKEPLGSHAAREAIEGAPAPIARMRRSGDVLRVVLARWAMGREPLAMTGVSTESVLQSRETVRFSEGRGSALIARHLNRCGACGIAADRATESLPRMIPRGCKRDTAFVARLHGHIVSSERLVSSVR